MIDTSARFALTPAQAEELAAGFLADRRAKHADFRMDATGDPTPAPTPVTTGTDGTPAPTGDPTPTPTAPATGPQAGTDGTLSFASQEALDAWAGKIRAQARSAAEKAATKAVEDAQALAGKSETEAAQIRLQQAETAAAATAARLTTDLLTARAEAAAASLGVKADRVEALIALGTATGKIVAAEDGSVDRAAITTAVEGLLAAFPEFKAATGTPETPAPVTPTRTGAVDPSQPTPPAPINLTDAVTKRLFG